MKLRELCKAINDAKKQSGKLSRLTHHIQGSILVHEAKPFGFGTHSALVKLHKGGWVLIDPISWDYTPSDLNY